MRLRHYEIVYIVRTDVGEEVITKLRDRIREIVEAHSGAEVKYDLWGKRKLAYEIDKNPKGVYHYYQFLADNKCVLELQRNLKIHDAVLKYMTIVLDPDVDSETFDFEAARAKAISPIAKGDGDRRRERPRDGGPRDGAPRPAAAPKAEEAVEAKAEVKAEATPEATPESTPEATPEADAEAKPEDAAATKAED